MLPKEAKSGEKKYEEITIDGKIILLSETQLKNNEAMGFRYDAKQKRFFPAPENRKPYQDNPDLDGMF